MSTETPRGSADDDGFRADVAAMLHRRAGDVADRPLTAMPAAHGGGGWGGRRRLLVAAAAGVALLVGVGTAVVASGGDGGGAEEVVASGPDRSSTTRRDGIEPRPAITAADPGSSTVPGEATTSTSIVGGGATTTTGPGSPGSGPTPGPGGTAPGGGQGTTDDSRTGGSPGAHATVTLSGQAQERVLQRRCDGSTVAANKRIDVWLERTGATAGPLTVNVAVSGPVTSPGGQVPTSLTFAAGRSRALLQLDMPDTGAVEVVVDIRPGDGYTPGQPARWQHRAAAPPTEIDCLRALPASPASQTIQLGERPANITIDHPAAGSAYVHPVGVLPEGLTDAGAGPGVFAWGGAATRPGTYTVALRACAGDLCVGTAEVTVVVEAP